MMIKKAVSLIDQQALNAYLPDRDTRNSVLAAAIRSINANSGKLQDAITHGDLKQIAFVAHAVMGIAGSIKAQSVYDSAAQTEQLASLNDNRVLDHARLLQHSIGQLNECIADILQEEASDQHS